MSSSPADSCLLFCPQLRLSPTLFSSYDFYDNMIFMFMTHAPGLPPSHHHHNSTPRLPHFHTTLWEVPFGRSYNSLWEVLSGRWEVVFYLVRFALLALVRARFSGPLFQPYFHQLHTRSTYILPLHDLCPHQDQEKTMSSTAKSAILLQNRAANKVYESTLFPLKSKSSPSSTPYPASTTSSTRLATSSS